MFTLAHSVRRGRPGCGNGRIVSCPLPADRASQIIADLGQWELHSPRVDDLLNAIDLQIRYKISFWDAMIIASARQLGCQVLWSEDLNDGQDYGDVTVKNPFL